MLKDYTEELKDRMLAPSGDLVSALNKDYSQVNVGDKIGVYRVECGFEYYALGVVTKVTAKQIHVDIHGGKYKFSKDDGYTLSSAAYGFISTMDMIFVPTEEQINIILEIEERDTKISAIERMIFTQPRLDGVKTPHLQQIYAILTRDLSE